MINAMSANTAAEMEERRRGSKDKTTFSQSASTSSSSTNCSNETHEAFFSPCSSLITDFDVNEDNEDNENKCHNDDNDDPNESSRHTGSRYELIMKTVEIESVDAPSISRDSTSSLLATKGVILKEKIQYDDKNKIEEEKKEEKITSLDKDPKYHLAKRSSRDGTKEEDTIDRTSLFFLQERESFKSSIHSKASPLALQSWIAVSLTLDGRDKITKVIQYTSRLLGYYYETFAEAIKDRNTDDLQCITYDMYSCKAKKFRSLYIAMSTSRKAYRFGRTFIELEKLKSMGLIHWMAWYLRRSMFMNKIEKYDAVDDDPCRQSPSRQDSTVSFHPNTKFKEATCSKKQKQETKQAPAPQNIPPRITLPRQISSNVGLKSSFLYNDKSSERYVEKLSYLGKFLFQSLSSVINEQMLTAQASNENQQSTKTPPPPLWKIVSSTFKLLGLAGFWAGDNISYLYSIGFLVEENDSKKIDKSGYKSKKSNRKKDATIFATRSYFLAAVAGLYLNSREWIRHRNGPFRDLMDKVSNLKNEICENESPGNENNNENTAYAEHQRLNELGKLETTLEETKQKHFNICLALLKVRCFSHSIFFTTHIPKLIVSLIVEICCRVAVMY